MVRKPLVVARNEFINNIVELINKAELPSFVIGDILKEIQVQIQEQAQNEYETAKKEYNKALSKQEE